MKTGIVLMALCLLAVTGCAQMQKEANTGLGNVSKVPDNVWKSNKK